MPPRERRLSGDMVFEVYVISVFGNTAVVIDQLGKKREIRVNLLRSKGPWPAPGERWLIQNDLGEWTFAAMRDVPAPKTITGSRSTDIASITIQLLEALAALGLVVDQTTV